MRRTTALGVVTAAVLAAAPALTASAPVPVPDPAPGTAGVAVAPDTAGAAVVPDPVAATGTTDGAPPAPVGAGPSPAAPSPSGPGTATVRTPEGFVVAPGTAAAGAGPRLRYSVEVDPATGLDAAAIAAVVDAALGDARSWARDHRLVRVADPDRADARLIVAPPDVIDALCAEAGLDTAGVYSCWNGRVVALNAWRWAEGAAGFPDLATYRTYLVNHEVGHVLGYGHVGCTDPGRPAPLMMQQSKGLDGCIANGWPHPDG